jgi:hypothetical protein
MMEPCRLVDQNITTLTVQLQTNYAMLSINRRYDFSRFTND